MWKNQTPNSLEECYTHNYCAYCRVCPGNNFSENGNPLIPSENNCSIAKIKFNLAEKIKKGYNPLINSTLQERLNEIEFEEVRLYRVESTDYRTKSKKING